MPVLQLSVFNQLLCDLDIPSVASPTTLILWFPHYLSDGGRRRRIFPLRSALSSPVSLFGCSPSASFRTPSQGRACSVGGEFGEKVPVVREAAGFFRTGPAPPDKRNAPPKRPPTLHAGGAESSPAVWPMGITQSYTLRYTLSYRLKLHPAPPVTFPRGRRKASPGGRS